MIIGFLALVCCLNSACIALLAYMQWRQSRTNLKAFDRNLQAARSLEVAVKEFGQWGNVKLPADKQSA
jgi:hypothetical protein